MHAEWINIDVDGTLMETYIALPDGDGPFPAVVVSMHAYGVDRGVQAFCDGLASEGYAAVAPYLYYRDPTLTNADLIGIPFEAPERRETGTSRSRALTLAMIERDSAAAVAYLRGLPQVGYARVGITGFCLGGRISLYMAGASDLFDASAIFYGTDINRGSSSEPSALSFAAGIRCALAGFFGSEDQNPSPADVDEVDAELDRLGIPHAFYRIEGAPHAFNDPFNPVRYQPDNAALAWGWLIEFFDDSLKTTQVASG